MQIPGNLVDLLERDLTEWKLRLIYRIILTPETRGIFPACIAHTQQVVLSLDLELIKGVWRSLPPRSSTLFRDLALVKKDSDEAIILPTTGYGQLELLARETAAEVLLTRPELDLLRVRESCPFSWIEDPFGEAIGDEEFQRLIERTVERYAKDREVLTRLNTDQQPLLFTYQQ